MPLNPICVLLTYNHPDISIRALKSILKFDFTKVIVVHNGSEKRNIQKIKESFQSEKVEHLLLEENKGFSGGANAGLNRAFIYSDSAIFVTSDTELISLPKVWDDHKVMTPLILRKNTDKVDSLWGAFQPGKAKIWHIKEEAFSSLNTHTYAPGTAFAVSRKIWNDVGGFDESLGTYWEDVDWSQRAQASGYFIQYDKTFQLRHGIGKTCHGNSLYTIYYFQRNRKRISWRYASNLQKFNLSWHLANSWFYLGVKLFRNKRWNDLKLLGRAIID